MMKYAYTCKKMTFASDVYCDDERDHMDLFTFFAGSIENGF